MDIENSNIFLIGLMGAGKSTVGKLIARKLNGDLLILTMRLKSVVASKYRPFLRWRVRRVFVNAKLKSSMS